MSIFTVAEFLPLEPIAILTSMAILISTRTRVISIPMGSLPTTPMSTTLRFQLALQVLYFPEMSMTLTQFPYSEMSMPYLLATFYKSVGILTLSCPPLVELGHWLLALPQVLSGLINCMLMATVI